MFFSLTFNLLLGFRLIHVSQRWGTWKAWQVQYSVWPLLSSWVNPWWRQQRSKVKDPFSSRIRKQDVHFLPLLHRQTLGRHSRLCCRSFDLIVLTWFAIGFKGSAEQFFGFYTALTLDSIPAVSLGYMISSMFTLTTHLCKSPQPWWCLWCSLADFSPTVNNANLRHYFIVHLSLLVRIRLHVQARIYK